MKKHSDTVVFTINPRNNCSKTVPPPSTRTILNFLSHNNIMDQLVIATECLRVFNEKYKSQAIQTPGVHPTEQTISKHSIYSLKENKNEKVSAKIALPRSEPIKSSKANKSSNSLRKIVQKTHQPSPEIGTKK